jgi:hypothetical protein
MRITVAAESEDAGVEGYRADLAWHYIRIEYRETLPAEIRLHFPADLFHPSPQDLEALETDGVEAELRSVENNSYSSLKVRFEGKADVTFAVPRAASLTFATRDHARDFVSNRTGYEFPSVREGAGGNEPWSYIEQSALAANATVAIKAKQDRKLTVQYDAGEFEEKWVSAPRCSASSGSDEPICFFTRDGEHNRVYVLSRTANPPPVRYKYDAGPAVFLRNVADSVGLTFERAAGWISGLFGTVIS